TRFGRRQRCGRRAGEGAGFARQRRLARGQACLGGGQSPRRGLHFCPGLVQARKVHLHVFVGLGGRFRRAAVRRGGRREPVVESLDQFGVALQVIAVGRLAVREAIFVDRLGGGGRRKQQANEQSAGMKYHAAKVPARRRFFSALPQMAGENLAG